MFGIIVSALNTFLAFFVRSVVAKFFVFASLFAIVTGFIPYLTDLLPSAEPLQHAFGSLPNSIWYFLQPFKISFGLNIVLSSLATRFIIRRIPIIG